MTISSLKKLLGLLTLFGLTLFLFYGLVSAASRSAAGDGGLANEPLMLPDGADAADDAKDRLLAAANGAAVIKTDPATGMVDFVQFGKGAALNLVSGGAAVAQADAFFEQYGSLFGLRDAAAELQLVDNRADQLGATRLTYQQVYQGVEVFAGLLFVHLNEDNGITAVNGTIVPNLDLNTSPALSAGAAEKTAVSQLTRQLGLENMSTDLAAKPGHLYVYREGLLQGIPGSNLLVYEVEVGNGRDTRQFLYLDANSGKLINQISGIYEAIDRRIYNYGFGPSFLVWTEGDATPYTGTDAAGINDLINYAEDTYNLFSSMTNGSYLSFDNNDGIMHSVLNDPGINCPNANWNGTSTNYCNNVSGDDTVAHEWGHAYTQYTHNLIYQWQSGAMNESYSDIWGEVVDFLNGAGLDSPGGTRSAGGCSVFGSGANQVDNSYRWLSGEDDPAFGGAIRDLWNPNCYGDPGKVTDSQYWCSTSDGGGVHTNSGVPNHGFALLVDGGVYNGQTISGVGLTKAAHIYWRAQTTYQAPASNFADHAAALTQSCADLTGATLYELSADSPAGVVSSEVISAGDCGELAKVVQAVELNTEPTQCNFTTLLDPNAPALCSAGTSASTISYMDWESGLGSWTVGTRSVANPATFDTPDWAVAGSLPGGRAGQAAFVEDNPNYGDCQSDTEAGVLYLQSPVIQPPSYVTSPRIAIDHWLATETGWDGGNFKISVNGGAWTLIPTSAFTFNAYNSSLSSSDNPLSGQSAFTGTDGGSNSGSWGQSQIDLTGIVSGGDSFKIRVEMGLDGCNGVIGWYVEEVQTYACLTGSPDFTLNSASQSQAICAGDDALYDLTIGSQIGFVDPVTLSASGHPAGTTALFSANPVTPTGNTTLTIGNTASAAGGQYNVEVLGVSPTRTHTITLGLDVSDSVPTAATLSSPASGAVDVELSPTFDWTAVSGALSYDFELATDAAFTTLVYTTTAVTNSLSLPNLLDYGVTYYWRVRAANICGGSGWSGGSFTTKEVLPFMADFNNGSGDVSQPAWTVVNNGGSCVWQSTEATGNANRTGGSGFAAEANAQACGWGSSMDTEMRSPLFSLAGAANPVLAYRYDYFDWFKEPDDKATVEVSDDGGASWAAVTAYSGGSDRGPKQNVVDLSAYIGQTDMQVRFVYQTPQSAFWFQVDDVQILPDATPSIDVTTTAISLTLAVGDVSTVTLDFANTDLGTLNWSLNEGCGSPVGWLSLVSLSGSTAGLGSENVAVSLDAAGLSLGVHTSSICVDSNDAGTPQVVTPVTLNVVGAPETAVNVSAITMNLDADGVLSQTLTISNTGSADLNWSLGEEAAGLTTARVNACQSLSDISWLAAAPASGTVTAGQKVDVTLTFDTTGLNGGAYQGNLCLQTNQPDGQGGSQTFTIPVALNVKYRIFLPVLLKP